MSLTTLLVILLVLAVFGPALGAGSWGYGGPYWGIGPILAVILLVVLLTRLL